MRFPLLTTMISYSAEMNAFNPLSINAHEYESLCKKRNCYEFIPYDKPVKLYFDVDIKYPVDDEQEGREYMIEMPRIRAMIQNVLSGFFGEKYDSRQVCISTSHSPFYKPYNAGKRTLDDTPICKLSFHFVFNNIIGLVSHQKLLVAKLNDYANTIIDADDRENIFKGDVFDTAPYGRNQKIRSTHSNKPLETRPLKIETGTFEQSCITAFIPEDAHVWIEEIPERPVSDANNSIVRDAEKDRAIFNAGLDLLAPYAQAGKYADWIRIGWAIKNTFNDATLWHTFSKLGGKEYDRSSVQDYWDNMEMTTDGVKMGTIVEYMRKTDKRKTDAILSMNRTIETPDFTEARNTLLEMINEDPDTDEETNSEQSVEIQKPETKPSYYIKIDELEDPYSCAIVVSNTLKHTLVLCKEKWYCVNDKNLWTEVKDPTHYITRETRKYIDEGNQQTAQQISRADGEAKDKLIEIQKRYLKAYKDISKPAFAGMLIRNLKATVCDNLFVEKLDRLTDCLAFKNGVYNMQTRKFRRGILPSDFITDTIQHDYMPANPEKTRFVKNALLKIMNNNPEHLEYLLSVIGYTFIGRANLEKAFYFCVDKTLQSKGDNGKTFYFDILTELMPCYVYNTKGNFLEKDNAKKHKQLTLMKGKRLVWLDEFGTKNMDAIFVKELANGLATENEVMFGTSEKINVQFKVFGLTNHTVKIGDNEDAVFNRYVQISYGSHFDKTGTLKEDIPDQLRFKADATLRDTLLRDYANEIFGLVIEYANKYYTSKLPKIPDQFANDAQETKLANDELGMWLQEYCVVDADGLIAIGVIVSESGIPKKRVLERMKQLGYKYNKDLSGLGKNEFGKANKGGYEGIKLIEKEDETFDMKDA